ncbi:MAG: TetR/AcrR family transcriptional regulator [Dehalococcoidia bacterium]
MSRVTEAHVEARRTAILEAAQSLFSRKGVFSATMAEIAEEAGLSAGALYRYFPNKEALAEACMDTSLDQMLQQWQQTAASAGDPLAAFHAVAAMSFDELKQAGAKDMTRLWTERHLAASRTDDPDLKAHEHETHTRVVGGLAAVLRAAADAGQLPPPLDPVLIAQALFAFYLGVRQLQMVGELEDGDELLAQVRILLDRARGAAPGRP